MAMPTAVRGALFFTGFLPSFTSLGYALRRLKWPEQEPHDFTGQRWLVTGASGGIGRAIAAAAAEAGAEVVVVARGEEDLRALEEEHAASAGQITGLRADLSLMREVSDVARQVGVDRVDVLVNNVGAMLNEKSMTSEGIEQSFATNVLGHYVLTRQLHAAGTIDGDSLVINMTSGGMYTVPLVLRALQGGRDYNGMMAYAYHKRALAALNTHWREQLGLASYVMHPGWVATEGVRSAMPLFQKLLSVLLRDADGGADTALWLAAERPEQQTLDGVWFDRKERPAHYFAGTAEGEETDKLVAYLDGVLHDAGLDRSEDAGEQTKTPALAAGV